MFKSEILIYIGKDRIWYGDIKGSNPKPGILKWDGGSLIPHLKKISSKIKSKNLKIIAGESNSYILAKSVPTQDEQDGILSAAISIIPDSVSSQNTKWQVFDTDTKNNLNWVEILSISDNLVSRLSEIPSELGTVESVAPISKLVAHNFKDEKAPVLCIWKGFETVAVVCFKGVVYFSSSSVGTKSGEISSIISQAKEEYNIKLKHLVTNWKDVQNMIKLPKSWKFEVKSIDPIAEIDKLKPSEMETYSLEVKSIQEDKANNASDDEEKEDKPYSKLKKIIFLLGLIIILIAASLGGYYYWTNIRDQEVTVTETETPELTEQPDETEEPQEAEPEEAEVSEIDFSNFNVQVQNGSGTAGVAGDIADRLTELGFVGIETNNADNFDYQGLTINYKEDISEELLSNLRSEFSDYELSENQSLEIDHEYDIILIVGAN